MGSSHVKALSQFGLSHGCGIWSLPGGGVTHAHQLIAKNRYFGGCAKQLILPIGGNDLSNPHFDSFQYVESIRNLVEAFCHFNPDAQIVTISPIPRDCSTVSASVFINRIELIDASLFNFHKRHHHLLGDVFVLDPPVKGGEPGIRWGLFRKDGVHLNKEGASMFEKMLSFVITSMSNNDYSRSCEFGEGLDFRLCFFKF